MKAHVVGNDEHQHVKTWLEQGLRDRPFQREAEVVEHTDGCSRQLVPMFQSEVGVHHTLGVPIDVLANIETNPFRIERRHLTGWLGWKKERTRGGKQEENDKHACTEAVGNSSHGLASGSCPLSVRS